MQLGVSSWVCVWLGDSLPTSGSAESLSTYVLYTIYISGDATV